ncbi:MAG: M48 family metalloprotease [Phycisphaeraceae bacterium]|nr:M48 family metalloprotease [Phycisphaeraceae bacterium]
MLHPLLIAMVAILLVGESFSGVPIVRGLSAWEVALYSLAPMALVGALSHLALWRIGRALDRRGDGRALGLADAVISVSRVGVLAAFAGAVIITGWFEGVRGVIGNVVGLDEALAMAPPVAVLAWVWWAYAPIDRRVREASVYSRLDGGERVEAIPTRWEFVWDHMRHGVLVVLVPIFLLVSWAEVIERVLDLPQTPGETMTRDEVVAVVLQLGGVVAVLSCAPLLLRFLWSTRPLGAGAMRDRLMGLCKAHGVRCAELLVWRSRTGMLNGAMVGVLPWLRYVLLTDALLERLSAEQVEAVMAHEVGHARRHHLPWMLGSIIASVGVFWVGADWLARSMDERGLIAQGIAAWLGVALTVAGIVVGVLVFGVVSRRFELQADAFAAQHLSGMHRGDGDDGRPVTGEAVYAMAGALGAVALYNHIPRRKFTYRHGSILGRQRALERLVGERVYGLAIDRKVRVIKLLTIAGLLAIGVMGYFSWR